MDMICQQPNNTNVISPLSLMAGGGVPGSTETAGKDSAARCSLHGSPGHAAVIGLGRSGLATAVFLSKQGLDVDVYDSNAKPALSDQLRQLAPDVRIIGGSLAVESWRDDSLLVVSPGVPLSHPDLSPLLAQGVRPVGDVELFAQCVQAPVIAITGSNGKSTVTVMLGEILKRAGLKAAVGGNIGVPVLELLENDNDSYEIYVLELSSFQLETTWSLNAASATVLNIAADHMDRYRDIDDYIASKQRIYNGNGKMLLNADDPYTPQLLQANREQIFFGASRPANEQDYGLCEIDETVYLCRGTASLMRADAVPLAGQHNLLNVLAAWALASSAGVADSTIKEAVTAFKGLPHRMECLGEIDGVEWINDSKGTNVGATVAAISGLQNPVVLIAGGIAKDADFTALLDVAKTRVRAAILIGRDADRIAEVLSAEIPVQRAGSMDDAVALAAQIARQGDTVILSPACASFDMFNSFEHRGDEFRRCVGGLR